MAGRAASGNAVRLALPVEVRGFLRVDAEPRKYDPSMSGKKTRITVTVDPHLAAYAERLVETGKAPSVSAVLNDALEEKVLRDRRARRWWNAKAAEAAADPALSARVSRMRAHIDEQVRRFEERNSA
jgi:Arc/MetJ-type ribon-helix-helix transcriptional regulator